jgi:uncharacterized membrane protein
MRRLEYMTILRQKLVEGGLENDEINDALEFYEELFLDGGYENEEKTAQNLGDPEKLAQQILAENGAVGFVRPDYKMDDAVDNRGAQSQAQPQQSAYDIAPDNRRTALILIVIISSVIWGPTLIGLLAGAFALAIGLAAGIFSIGCAGVGLLVTGGVTAFQAPPVGVLMIGVGLFLIGLGVLLFMPFCKFVIGLFKKFFTWLIGALRKLFSNINNSKAVSENG